jgi:antirestriction protein ArdC
MASVKTSPSSRASAEERLVASLMALLEAGTTPWRRDWDAAAGGHQVNLFTGRRYRGANPVLLLLGQHLRASSLPYWCGFAEARARGLFPRKGSKAAHVLRPQVHQGHLPEATGRAGEEEAEIQSASGSGWVSYRPMAVFNAADLEGEALAGLIAARRAADGLACRAEPERLAAAEQVLGRWPVPVRFEGDRACYLPAVDQIWLPARDCFHSAAALYATWAHEAIHSTGHANRLARDLSGGMGAAGDGGRAYAREELVAELGAVLLGDRLEIGSDASNHAAYLAGWLDLLRQSPRVLLRVLSDARRAADLICPELEECQTPSTKLAGITPKEITPQTSQMRGGVAEGPADGGRRISGNPAPSGTAVFDSLVPGESGR